VYRFCGATRRPHCAYLSACASTWVRGPDLLERLRRVHNTDSSSVFVVRTCFLRSFRALPRSRSTSPYPPTAQQPITSARRVSSCENSHQSSRRGLDTSILSDDQDGKVVSRSADPASRSMVNYHCACAMWVRVQTFNRL
jgi:hypothetical protein